ncbi:MAG TPA: hypothetical protein VME92_12155 [Acetobacteraceae bacterium]|nr:hypothetical protein [Acetobacteraceae bacterium]
MPTPLLLGPVTFVGFEVPERLTFGGRQRLAIHRLPGGARVIDAMGPDDAELAWAGVFSGPDAADRARTLDALRIAGAMLPLTWDAFLYSVIISCFQADYASPWWIPYRISCTVVLDPAQLAISAAATLADDISADLVTASAGVDVSAAQAAMAPSDAATAGTADQAAALSSLQSTQTGLENSLNAAGGGLASGDLNGLVGTTGQLAQLSTARGYIGRAVTNLGNAST